MLSQPRLHQGSIALAIRNVVNNHLVQIVACFERDGLTSTRVDVDFTIGTTAKVASIRKKNPAGNVAALRRRRVHEDDIPETDHARSHQLSSSHLLAGQ